METGWAVEYAVERAFSEGFALLLTGPRRDGEASCVIRMQLVMHSMEIYPWHELKDSQIVRFEIPAAEAHSLHALFAEARVNAFPPAVAGVDGETHTLTLHGIFNQLRFRWFMELPQCWSSLAPIVHRLAKYADRGASLHRA